jgi:RNA polymerase sigma-70 factor (ECF subfamily)
MKPLSTQAMMQPVDDVLAQRLLKRCAEKDERALKDLHRVMAPRIHAFAFHRLRDASAAETVVVDTLYEVWKCAAKFRGESRVSTWVLGIARHKIFALARQSGPEHDDIDDHAESLPGTEPDGATALSRWQEEQVVHACMHTLSAAHRECLQLVYFEGLGLADVAAIQRVPENTVKTRLFHARKSMRACVEQRLGSPS